MLAKGDGEKRKKQDKYCNADLASNWISWVDWIVNQVPMKTDNIKTKVHPGWAMDLN